MYEEYFSSVQNIVYIFVVKVFFCLLLKLKHLRFVGIVIWDLFHTPQNPYLHFQKSFNVSGGLVLDWLKMRFAHKLFFIRSMILKYRISCVKRCSIGHPKVFVNNISRVLELNNLMLYPLPTFHAFWDSYTPSFIDSAFRGHIWHNVIVSLIPNILIFLICVLICSL